MINNNNYAWVTYNRDKQVWQAECQGCQIRMEIMPKPWASDPDESEYRSALDMANQHNFARHIWSSRDA